ASLGSVTVPVICPLLASPWAHRPLASTRVREMAATILTCSPPWKRNLVRVRPETANATQILFQFCLTPLSGIFQECRIKCARQQVPDVQFVALTAQIGEDNRRILTEFPNYLPTSATRGRQ